MQKIEIEVDETLEMSDDGLVLHRTRKPGKETIRVLSPSDSKQRWPQHANDINTIVEALRRYD